jgi:hypothetical protein
MKKLALTISVLLATGWILFAYGQKAYDHVTYRATIYGNAAVLILADGYLLASKLTIHSKLGNQAFTPNANEADKNGNLQFNAVKSSGRFKNNKGPWFIISGLDQPNFPVQIKAIYWDGKIRKAVVFR